MEWYEVWDWNIGIVRIIQVNRNMEWDCGWYRKAGMWNKKSHKVFGNQ